ncbi:heavy metal sensor histidine kinase [uncultured Massilia sp.]|uniref:heavy metal sensor histidine kinase n=1 Tax=uncultured Massilia sp. TaxID=169973 RepID=UPI0025EF9DCF|nr:heavy metal sensor histidine kinase [uncultured Massilia sp.]
MSSKSATDARGAWSLTLRMSVFVGVAITVIVLGVSAMMYSELVRQLRAKEEAELRENLQIQRDTLEYLVGRRIAPSQWQYEWREYQDAHQAFAWQLLTPARAVRASSPNLAAFAPALAAPVRPGTFVRIDAADDDHAFLVHDLPVDTRGPEALEVNGPALGERGAVLRGVLDVGANDRLLTAYRHKLAAVIASAIVAAAALAWLLARRGLAPVRAMSLEIGRINAEKLHARIARDDWPAELRALAGSFDDMLARLEQSFDQLTRFSSDIAHEFRSPVNNLVAAASVTLARARTPAEYQATLEVVVEEGGRLSRMVASMLFLARADNAEQHLRTERMALGAEFRKLLEFYDIAAEEQGVTLVAHGDVDLVADPLLVRRALSNLLSNALRYTPRGGTVRLLAERRDGHVVVAVADDGAGIAAQHLPFLFDRFYRVDPARSSTDSTGLGLAVVRSIVELHGGRAEVASAPGKGSTFTLHFPERAAAADRGAAAPEREAAP